MTPPFSLDGDVVQELFEIISKVHCNEKGHIGSKKTVTKVRLTLGYKI